MKVKTSELTGPALDWAVAQCEGEDFILKSEINGIGMEFEATSYSTNWAQGGAVIEREWIEMNVEMDDDGARVVRWRAFSNLRCGTWSSGPTPLLAAMRCYVASKLGDEADIPDELLA